MACSARSRDDFNVDPRLLRRGLLDNSYDELAVTGEHALAVMSLSLIHKDPFDRILVAQSLVEGIVLLTADRLVGHYGGAGRQV
nr:type II toxin-antitoxin system VapC family toxin [uncultured Rhodopila sp.]